MWPTIDGLRVLKDAEAGLVRRSVRVMVDQLVAEFRDHAEPWQTGIDWFDQWDCEQRVWLLEQVTAALLTNAEALPPAAIWEATVDAIFCHVVELILSEIDETSVVTCDDTWRQSVLDAFRSQHGRSPEIRADQTDIGRWQTLLTQIADAILGVTAYQQAELFRDGEIERARRFLTQKGLSEDYLERIPPLRTTAQTEASIDRIASILVDSQS